jgi:hypothetical protein
MNTSFKEILRFEIRRGKLIVSCLLSFVFLLSTTALLINPPPVQAHLVPLENTTSGGTKFALQTTGEISSSILSEFVSTTEVLDSKQVVGIYAPGKFAFPVVQQPEDKPWFVSSAPRTVTQFHLAKEYGSLGFLAHNTLAGSSFHELQLREDVRVIYGDGNSGRYIIGEILRFQALEPSNPYSTFRKLDGSGKIISSTDLFNIVYGVSSRVVLQTCIEQDGNPNWGRVFIIAYPAKEHFSLFDLLAY